MGLAHGLGFLWTCRAAKLPKTLESISSNGREGCMAAGRQVAGAGRRPRDEGASYPRLTGRRVFVTGGATGIGAAIVEAFARQGTTVAFVDIAEGAARELAD